MNNIAITKEVSQRLLPNNKYFTFLQLLENAKLQEPLETLKSNQDLNSFLISINSIVEVALQPKHSNLLLKLMQHIQNDELYTKIKSVIDTNFTETNQLQEVVNELLKEDLATKINNIITASTNVQDIIFKGGENNSLTQISDQLANIIPSNPKAYATMISIILSLLQKNTDANTKLQQMAEVFSKDENVYSLLSALCEVLEIPQQNEQLSVISTLISNTAQYFSRQLLCNAKELLDRLLAHRTSEQQLACLQKLLDKVIEHQNHAATESNNKQDHQPKTSNLEVSEEIESLKQTLLTKTSHNLLHILQQYDLYQFIKHKIEYITKDNGQNLKLLLDFTSSIFKVGKEEEQVNGISGFHHKTLDTIKNKFESVSTFHSIPIPTIANLALPTLLGINNKTITNTPGNVKDLKTQFKNSQQKIEELKKLRRNIKKSTKAIEKKLLLIATESTQNGAKIRAPLFMRFKDIVRMKEIQRALNDIQSNIKYSIIIRSKILLLKQQLEDIQDDIFSTSNTQYIKGLSQKILTLNNSHNITDEQLNRIIFDTYALSNSAITKYITPKFSGNVITNWKELIYDLEDCLLANSKVICNKFQGIRDLQQKFNFVIVNDPEQLERSVQKYHNGLSELVSERAIMMADIWLTDIQTNEGEYMKMLKKTIIQTVSDILNIHDCKIAGKTLYSMLNSEKIPILDLITSIINNSKQNNIDPKVIFKEYIKYIGNKITQYRDNKIEAGVKNINQMKQQLLKSVAQITSSNNDITSLNSEELNNTHIQNDETKESTTPPIQHQDQPSTIFKIKEKSNSMIMVGVMSTCALLSIISCVSKDNVALPANIILACVLIVSIFSYLAQKYKGPDIQYEQISIPLQMATS